MKAFYARQGRQVVVLVKYMCLKLMPSGVGSITVKMLIVGLLYNLEVACSTYHHFALM